MDVSIWTAVQTIGLGGVLSVVLVVAMIREFRASQSEERKSREDLREELRRMRAELTIQTVLIARLSEQEGRGELGEMLLMALRSFGEIPEPVEAVFRTPMKPRRGAEGGGTDAPNTTTN